MSFSTVLHISSNTFISHSATLNFRDEDKTEWIYREPGLTSLAEACERMIEATRRGLGHEHVEVLPENQIDSSRLNRAVAYIQMTHVEPFQGDADEAQAKVGDDPMNYACHTNVRCFFYEEPWLDESVPKKALEQARLALKRVYLIGIIVVLGVGKIPIFSRKCVPEHPPTTARSDAA